MLHGLMVGTRQVRALSGQVGARGHPPRPQADLDQRLQQAGLVEVGYGGPHGAPVIARPLLQSRHLQRHQRIAQPGARTDGHGDELAVRCAVLREVH